MLQRSVNQLIIYKNFVQRKDNQFSKNVFAFLFDLGLNAWCFPYLLTLKVGNFLAIAFFLLSLIFWLFASFPYKKLQKAKYQAEDKR